MQSKYRIIFILSLILIMQFALRLPFLNEPLEGDEGAYAYMGQRVLANDVPYRDFFDHKPPAVYYIYAVILKLLGQTIFSIRFATAVLGLLTAFFVFLAGRELFSETFGLISAFLYALFSGGPLIDGAGSNTEAFMILFLMTAFYFFAAHKNSAWRLFLCGLFSGLAFMTKQVAMFNFLVLLAFAIVEERNPHPLTPSPIGRGRIPICNPFRLTWVRAFIVLLFGFLIVPAGFALYFFLNNGLIDFVEDAFLFNFGYVQTSFDLFSLYRTAQIALYENSIIWLLGAAGMVYIIIKEKTSKYWLLVVWFIASMLGVFSGGFFFSHYYIQVIPALCLLSGVAIMKWQERGLPKFYNIMAVFFLLLLMLPVAIYQFPFYFLYSPEQISIDKYGHNEMIMAKLASEKIIKKERVEGEAILVKYFPQIYFYTRGIYPGKYFHIPTRGGMEAKLSICGREIYAKTFPFNRITKDIWTPECLESLKILKDPKTKLVIDLIPEHEKDKRIPEIEKYGYKYSAELSEGDCRVFKRIKSGR